MKPDRIDGREVTASEIRAMTNCRLKKTLARLNQLLMAVETEVSSRMGKGGGGLQ